MQLTFKSMEEAEAVIDGLKGVIKRSMFASLEDLNDLIGVPSTYTAHTLGWMSLENVKVRQVEQEYIVDLPAAEPI